jgi:toxin ParE1/3/4
MTARRVVKRASVHRDVVACALYLADRRPTSAEAFLDAVEETLRFLCDHPRAGRRHEFQNPKLVSLRSIGVRRFANFRVFYFVVEDDIEVVHVIHGARDLMSHFEGLDTE